MLVYYEILTIVMNLCTSMRRTTFHLAMKNRKANFYKWRASSSKKVFRSYPGEVKQKLSQLTIDKQDSYRFWFCGDLFFSDIFSTDG